MHSFATTHAMFLQLAFDIILTFLCFVHTPESAQITISPKCDSMCGKFEIPYPFGMNDPACYVGKWFEIECLTKSMNNVPTLTPYLKAIDLEVKFIDVLRSTVTIWSSTFTLNCHHDFVVSPPPFIYLRGSPFVYSQEKNKFVALGCNLVTYLLSNAVQVGACASFCDSNDDIFYHSISGNYCSGKYCCESSLPLYLSEFNVTSERLTGKNRSQSDCSYAMIVEEAVLESVSSSLADLTNLKFTAVLAWEIVNSSLQLPDNCQNSYITSSERSHSGRTCNCYDGFVGNPYIPGGCIKGKTIHHRGSGYLATILAMARVGSIILLLGSWWLHKVVRKRVAKKRKEKNFKQNGGLLLQQRLSTGEVSVEKVKHLSLKDLEKATDSFNVNRILGKGGQGTVYKGMLVDGQIVAVKKFKVEGNVEEFINEFVILSQINHRNVVKLLGCCLETEIPLLVYEFIPNGNLFQYLHDQNEDLPMTWEMRLRIATEVAEAIFYLHSAASQPIYHRDVKSTNILLDEKYRAKVADFGASKMISLEDTHLTTAVQGTFGYLDPEYFHTSQLTEKSDVYSFGVVLVELLTGQKPISSSRTEEAKSLSHYFICSMEENRVFDIIDERVTKEGEKEHIIAVANLAYRCLELNGRNRPSMKEVASELYRILKLEMKPSTQQNIEETEFAGIEEYQSWAASSVSDIGSN
ncbi:wall-associated receptor kinase-like 1 [Arachis stenosperma]|uniref:wall-associated receptor kinase-like 1 n=1 Tax=Arachis stenosperma TaxID=217475 RepID=UPI0025AD6DAC|nr:wall-associated receptor kinase-like 1 [Arachis stenosperma]